MTSTAPARQDRPDGKATASAALEIRRLRFRHADPSRHDRMGADGGESDSSPDSSPNPRWTIALPALSLAPGEQVLLTGTSGSGKSTLLHLIAGLLEPADGSVRIDGTDIHALRGAARDRFRGRRIGMIFQTFHLLNGFSALENVMVALMLAGVPPREHRERAHALLARLGIAAIKGAIERPVERLSVGQQQRVAVARAVACAPALVLADEPTASLDPETAGTAMELIQETCREIGAALLCTSHDPSLAARFSRRADLLALRSEVEAAP